ncbi:sulfite exporter TauE/SafE family protein [Andreprevotia chitinilytica]|uniref:sulfite exporter TauE/SafE family protein n=1 Tax=Andreprevotia chitinilytica TaxID=396808 RepID=UPI0005531C36|nr:sulfite exporter TauE/SafE family protein [Andreprevotia chitinilytica]
MLTHLSWLGTQLPLAGMSGLSIGFLLGLVGGGGGILAVPLLLYVVKVNDPHLAIGTAALAVASTALINLAGYARAGLVRWRIASAFAVAGVAGAFAGSTLALLIDGQALMLFLAVLMLCVAALMLGELRPSHAQHQPSANASSSTQFATAGAGLAIGGVSGFFGIGGGFLIVPALHFITRLSTLEAIASSLLSVAAFGATTAVNYAIVGKISVPLSLALVGGGIIGGTLGRQAAKALARKKGVLNALFAALLVLVAGYVAYRSNAG